MKYRMISILLMFSCSFLHAQFYLGYLRDHPDATFYEVRDAVESYYNGKDKGRGSGYKQFRRWAMRTEPYVYPDGKLVNQSAEILKSFKAFQRTEAYQQRSTHGHWEDEGPHSYTRIGNQGNTGGNGRVNCIEFHPSNPQEILVGTPAGGLWRTFAGGNSWEPLTDGLPALAIMDIAIDPADPLRIFMLTGDGPSIDQPSIGVIKSSDGGNTWEKTGLDWSVQWDYNNMLRPWKIIMHPTIPDILMVATDSCMWRTTNGGATWTNVLDQVVHDIEFHPENPNIVYASGFTFYRSENGGGNWNVDADPDFPGGFQRTAIAVSPDAPDRVYMLFGGNNAGTGTFCGLYVSDDIGEDFQLASNTPNILGYDSDGQDDKHQAGYDLALAVDPENANIVYSGGINVWKSTNGGTDWEILSHWEEKNNTIGYTHADIHSIEIHNGTLYCGSDGGIFSSANDGEDWVNLSEGLGIMQFFSIDVVAGVIVGGTQDNGCNTWNSGNTHADHVVGGDGGTCILDFTNTSIQYHSAFENKYRTDNGGTTMTYVNVPGYYNYQNADWIIDPWNPQIHFMAREEIWRDTTMGSGPLIWENINAGFTNNRLISTMIQGFFQPNVLYASDNVSIRKTTNAYGNAPQWSDISNGLPLNQAQISQITVDPFNADRLWVSFFGIQAGIKVYFSPDGGTSWLNESGSLPNVPVNCIQFADWPIDGIYIGTDIGVFYRNDNIGDWIFFNNGMPATRVIDLDLDGERIYAATYGRGVWSSDLYTVCPANLVLTQANDPSNPVSTGKQEYHASSSITSSRIITGGTGTYVQYRAGFETILTDGFWVKTNSQMQISNYGCPE